MFQVVFNRENILSLFEEFGVPKKFDFLSEDSDAYDFFLVEAILEVSNCGFESTAEPKIKDASQRLKKQVLNPSSDISSDIFED